MKMNGPMMTGLIAKEISNLVAWVEKNAQSESKDEATDSTKWPIT